MSARRRTPPQGVPTWDDDMTPPPQDVPVLPVEDIPAPIREQIRIMADAVNSAQARAYESRLASHRLDKIDAKLGSVASVLTRHQIILDESLMPQLDRWRAVSDGIAKELPGVLAKLEALGEALERFDRRIRDLEVEIKLNVQRLTDSHETLAGRVAAIESKAADVALRVIELEKREHGRDQHAAALAKTERRKTGALSAAVASVIGVIHAVVSYFTR